MRFRIEQAFGKLESFKRIALLCKKTDQIFSAFGTLALSFDVINPVDIACFAGVGDGMAS